MNEVRNKGALCAYVIRLRASYNQNDVTYSDGLDDNRKTALCQGAE